LKSCFWVFVWVWVLLEVAGAFAVERSWLPWLTSSLLHVYGDPDAFVFAVTGVEVASGACVTVTVWGAL
jgi:hypothetical protein